MQKLISNRVGFDSRIKGLKLIYGVIRIDNQKDWVNINPPKIPRIFSLTVYSIVSPMCLLGSIFPVFLMASSFLSFLVSSSILLDHSLQCCPILLQLSPLLSVIYSWSFNFSVLFHLDLYKFSSIFCSSSFVR